MKVVIATVQDLFVIGGAEFLITNLQHALVQAGHEVEIVRLPFRWQPHRELLKQALQWRMIDLDGTDADLVITTKFPTFYIKSSNKIAWVFHQHRPLYDSFDDPIYSTFSSKTPEDLLVQQAITRWDTRFLAESKRIFSISQTVTNRLMSFNGLASVPLYHPPPSAGQLQPGKYGDYIFLPSRLEVNKRPWLLVEALAKTRTPVRAILCGRGSQEKQVRALAKKLGVEDRIELRGYVSSQERSELYSQALAVFYPPYNEDLGYVTLEALLCEKPVITLADSGGPTEFVRDGENGFIKKDAEEAAIAFDTYFTDRELARQHGRMGREVYATLVPTWEVVCQKLLETAQS